MSVSTRLLLESGNAEVQTRYEGIGYGTDVPVQHMVIHASRASCSLVLYVMYFTSLLLTLLSHW